MAYSPVARRIALGLIGLTVAVWLLSGCYYNTEGALESFQNDLRTDIADAKESRSSAASAPEGGGGQPSDGRTDEAANESAILGMELPQAFALRDTGGGGQSRDWASETWSYPWSFDADKYPNYREDTLARIANQFPTNGWMPCEHLVDSWGDVGNPGYEAAYSDGAATVLITFNTSMGLGVDRTAEMYVLWAERGRCVTGYPVDNK